MFIEKLSINDYRSFKKDYGPYEINLGKYLTCISGHNGIGKTSILAVLSNCGELKKRDGAHLNGQPFKGEYSQLIKGDKKFDSTGEKATLTFKEHDEDDIPDGNLSFRAAFQNHTIRSTKFVEDQDNSGLYHKKQTEKTSKRYRLIPVKTEKRDNERKIEWPTYYLGLSRLYPIGESDEIANKPLSLPQDIQKEFVDSYVRILSMNQAITSSNVVQTPDAKNKRGAALTTEEYGVLANSSGQDNLGQILLSVFSFEKLKQDRGENYNGGLLLIDELDATLHPFAQAQLYDFLKEKSKQIGLQIVFTTHSLSLIKHMYSDGSINDYNTARRLVYLTNSRGRVEIKTNPTMAYIENDLKLEYGKPTAGMSKIPLLVEDEVARLLLQVILEHYKLQPYLKENDASISALEICKLIRAYPEYFYRSIIILDGDMSNEDNASNIRRTLSGSEFVFGQNDTGVNRRKVLCLPGAEPMETELWNMMKGFEESDSFFYESGVEDLQISKRSFIVAVEANFDENKKPLENHKEWYATAPESIQKLMMMRWVQENLNQCNKFVKEFIDLYNDVGKFHGLDKLKISKDALKESS